MRNGSMRAVGVIPRKREVGLFAHPAPRFASPTEVLIRTLEVGVCGTDREICCFEYGTPPQDSEYLVLGHEALGEVVEVGPAVSRFRPGDLVVPTVRRPCPHAHCASCLMDRQDFCATGDFTERGIKMHHGYLTESFVEEEKFLNLAPPELRDVAVLVEPLTVAEKALAQVWHVQQRLPWENPVLGSNGRGHGKTAVVLGAGPVGILGAMALLIHGFKTFVYSRSPMPNPKGALVEAIGARYICAQEVPVERFAADVGNIDLVYEAVGVGGISFEVLRHMGLNGIFIFSGIPAHKPAVPVLADSIMREMVLKNQVALGTVNADRPAFEAAIRDLAEFKRRWPQALASLISGRFPLEAHRDLLVGRNTGIKNVLTFA